MLPTIAMEYFYYTLTFLLFVGLTATVLLYRPTWFDNLHRYATTAISFEDPNRTFRDDVEEGLHSTTFDLSRNVTADSRTGLDPVARREVVRIMKRRGITFDQARLQYVQKSFQKHGIDANGIPNDPRLVTFS